MNLNGKAAILAVLNEVQEAFTFRADGPDKSAKE